MPTLNDALNELKSWQLAHGSTANRSGRCLESVRYAIAGATLERLQGDPDATRLSLPPPIPKPLNTALGNMDALCVNPEAFGWQRVKPDAHGNLPQVTLDYYANCGTLPDGRIAGHIAIVDRRAKVLYSCTDFPLTAWWQARRAASFVPLIG